MRQLFYFMVFALLCCCCKQVNKSEKPTPFYDQEKMVSIITDMYLMEGSMSTNRKSFLETSIRPDSFLYKKYRIDSIGYVQNFNYYSDRVEEYEEILNLVEKRLKNIQKDINKIENEPATIEGIKSKNDSILIDSMLQKQLKRPRNPLLIDKSPSS